ncbi:hypothetical protein AB0957_36500, partial [Streptomyces zhihengii]
MRAPSRPDDAPARPGDSPTGPGDAPARPGDSAPRPDDVTARPDDFPARPGAAVDTEAGRRAAAAALLRHGTVIPAHPLALDARRRLDERRQRALTRYYLDAGAGQQSRAERLVGRVRMYVVVAGQRVLADGLRRRS